MSVHLHYHLHDTIAAIATPLGEGAIAIIRISGKEALSLAQKVYSGNISTYNSHTVHLGKITNLEGQIVDQVLLTVMRAPRSYTGEDVIEIQCHGGSLITSEVFQCVLSAGARAALPGEFTYRAFMNGKMDLAQAEAVQELIAAKNALSIQAAENQLNGALSKKILSFQQELIDIAAILEAWVDFPEEGLEFASLEEVLNALENVLKNMQHLNDTFYEGKIVSEGFSLCLVGSPNVGKSSIMNALLGKERAIVTPIAGTTRDLLEEDLRLSGLHFRLIDTAGIRETEELVEQEGIRRSKQAMQQADLILLVVDASKPLNQQDEGLIAQAPAHKTIVIWNKIDLPICDLVQIPLLHAVKVSAKSSEGLPELKKMINELIWKKGPPSKEEILITSARHRESLTQAIDSLHCLIDGLKKGISPEFLSSDMRNTLNELGKIIGLDISEEILSAIFSKFCVGK